jgi:hypothetical protein
MLLGTSAVTCNTDQVNTNSVHQLGLPRVSMYDGGQIGFEESHLSLRISRGTQ